MFFRFRLEPPLNRRLLKYDYITITDGDLKVEDIDSTFKEIIKNLNLENVGVSCVDLTLDNFPHHIPNSNTWLPSNCITTKEYIECSTGVLLMTLKKENIELLYSGKFIDSAIASRTKSQNLKWVKTKLNKAYHLTWDLYVKGNPYYEFKIQNIDHFWNHSSISPYLKII